MNISSISSSERVVVGGERASPGLAAGVCWMQHVRTGGASGAARGATRHYTPRA